MEVKIWRISAIHLLFLSGTEYDESVEADAVCRNHVLCILLCVLWEK